MGSAESDQDTADRPRPQMKSWAEAPPISPKAPDEIDFGIRVKSARFGHDLLEMVEMEIGQNPSERRADPGRGCEVIRNVTSRYVAEVDGARAQARATEC